jgi:hypothetical protein
LAEALLQQCNHTKSKKVLDTALLDIESRLRRVMGYRHLATLREAVQCELNIGGAARAHAGAA